MNDNQNQKANALELLAAIDPSLCSYSDWLRVGMALKNLGCDVQAWSEWSEMDPERFHTGECEGKWPGFERDGRRQVLIATEGGAESYEAWRELDASRT